MNLSLKHVIILLQAHGHLLIPNTEQSAHTTKTQPWKMSQVSAHLRSNFDSLSLEQVSFWPFVLSIGI